MQAFIQGVLNGARDFEQQPSCKAKRWCVSVGACLLMHISGSACLLMHISGSVSVDSYQWERVSADVYQWERCLFFLTAFCGGCNSDFLLRFLEDSA